MGHIIEKKGINRQRKKDRGTKHKQLRKMKQYASDSTGDSTTVYMGYHSPKKLLWN